ncbi:MAG: DUF3187 family protein [Planctomycetes bacterium]|nr:DUF3187 family protein [Planctomycetota bacterium]
MHAARSEGSGRRSRGPFDTGPSFRPLRAGSAVVALVLGVLACTEPARAAPPEPQPRLQAREAPARTLRRRTPGWHGPIEMRETWALAQPLMTLPATSAEVLPCGCSQARVFINRGNDFGWRQNVEGENPAVRDFLVDAEHQTTAIELRHGVARGFDVGIRVPVWWRGAGFMDEVIDLFHETTGLMDNIRSAFDNDRYRIEGRLDDGLPFSWNDEHGVGLGRIELEARRSLGRHFGGDWAAVMRVGLPTSTGPYRFRDGVDFGGQLVHSRCLNRRVALHAGVGVVRHGDRSLQGVHYAQWRPHWFVALEIRVTPRMSALVQSGWANKLADNIVGYPDTHGYLDFGVAYKLSARTTLEVLINENLENQQSTTDFGFLIGLVHRF